jgi:hypothetical protein
MKTFLKIIFVVLLLVFVGILLAALCVYKTRSDAKGIHSNINIGMNARQVHQELNGRYVCTYQIHKNTDEIDMVEKEEFLHEISGPNTKGEMSIHILGLTPYKVSFKLRFDNQGILYEKSDPYGWD